MVLPSGPIFLVLFLDVLENYGKLMVPFISVLTYNS
jgi:hypothetical protein